MTWADVEPRLRDSDNLAFLCDIVVPEAVAGDWQPVLDVLRRHEAEWKVTYSEDGVPSPLPESADVMVERSARTAVKITTDVDGLPIYGHVFADDWIEFDVPARDIDGPGPLDVLVGFVVALGRALGKEVRATPESAHDAPLFHYDPAHAGCHSDCT